MSAVRLGDSLKTSCKDTKLKTIHARGVASFFLIIIQ